MGQRGWAQARGRAMSESQRPHYYHQINHRLHGQYFLEKRNIVTGPKDEFIDTMVNRGSLHPGARGRLPNSLMAQVEDRLAGLSGS